ncbi:MAG TPA: translocation/assembly module TamB domain-containing protein [Bryobacteraceae bacterium]|jgi:translocation and assembly module TamB|nr:translocation/assembly module TamB domain-containing protein [Bryobacteraceae bacterium]
MSRPARIIRNIAIGVVALAVVLIIAAIVVVQTDWFRAYVKRKIITSTEESTGGRVEVNSFSFDWRHMRAVVIGFVIHGSEPSGAAPFLSAQRVQADIRLFTSIHHILDLAYLGIERPQANVIVLADGRTNIPNPKPRSTSNDTPLETVVNLAVDHFELTDGLVTVASQKQAVNIRGNDLKADLWYNVLNQGYRGQLSFQPLYVASGRNTPVNFTITLPVALQRDRIEFHDAKISTALSSILINGSVETMRDPKISAHVNGRLALADLKNVGELPIATDQKNLPSAVDLDGNALITGNSIQVNGLRLGIGQSNIEASGTLKSPLGTGALEFKSRLVLGELGRLAKLGARLEGTMVLNGTAKLDANNNYQVAGNVQATGLSFVQSGQRISNVNLYSAMQLDPHNLDLKGLRLAAFGGEFEGNASLQDFVRYRVDGSVRNLDLGAAARAAGQKRFPYSGVVSGPMEAAGDLKQPGTASVTATARLSITPGKRGIPVSGRLNAAYNGSADDIRVENSYIALPHTRLTLNGAVDKQLNVAVTSSDLNDLLAATELSSKPPVVLNGGQASFTGAVTGMLTSPRITGHLAVTRFSVEGRGFDKLDADAAVSSGGAAIRNGALNRGPMQAQFSGAVGLKNWKALASEPVAADATIHNGDLADMLALAGQPSADYSGMLSANLHLSGTVGNPRGSAGLLATNGVIHGEPFDRVQAQVTLTDQLVTITNASLESGPARVNLTAEFQHPRDSFTTGRIHAHVQSNQVDLAQIRNVQKQRPNTSGTLQLNADVTGNLSKSEFLLASVNGDASAHGLRYEGQDYGDFTANAHTNGSSVTYAITSDFAGSNVRVNGNTQLARGYPTTADASIRNLPVERVLQIAQRTDIPAKGNLSGTAHLTGTMDNPRGSADVDLASAVIYDEPLDHLRARVTYLEKSIDVQQLQIVSGPSQIDLTAHYDHPEGNLQQGSLQFRVNSSRVDLARIQHMQEQRPGLGGILQMSANGAAEIREKDPRVELRTLDANVKATGIAAHGKNFGDATLTANTSSGKLNFTLDSNLASAAIHGTGNAQLNADYPIDARLAFSNVTWSRIQDVLGFNTGEPLKFEAVADGQVSLKGPVAKTDQLSGSLQITRLQVNNIPGQGTGSIKPIMFQNQGPISATLDHEAIRIDNAHITGPQTDLEAKGTVPVRGQAMNVTVNGNMNLAMLQNFSQDITSSGSVVLATTVRGPLTKPLVNGSLELKNASFNYATLPNGISNANGVVRFNGNNAQVRNMTAESGGGQVTLDGFTTMDDTLRFGLRANASNVRIRLQPGVSVVTDANVRLAGTTDTSVLSGTVTIDRVTYAPRTDLGSVLTRAAPPVQSAAPSPLLDNMKLDLQIRTSDATAVQTSLAENLQADANLRVRGTASNPGVLGRITINEGKLLFFGTSYKVNTGTIGFYNPVRVEPILDLSLETTAKGVDVVLQVTGPVDNMKLSYTSDPPLQFQEIIGLLAAGSTPTSDPTLLANQPSQPPQNFQQMGESALVGKAVADPVASQLQRVFGVSQFKIDPTFTNGSALPTAQLTLQQQIASNLTFTYVTPLNSSNTQTIRVEWALNPQWSAVAMRDENGVFSVSFLYKKQLH